MRGRVQLEWRATSQVRAEGQRTWLNGQLDGRAYISQDLPRVATRVGGWETVADIAFDTTAEGENIKTLCLSRMAADSFILAGSWTQFHHCDHEDGANTCAVTFTKVVK